MTNGEEIWKAIPEPLTLCFGKAVNVCKRKKNDRLLGVEKITKIIFATVLQNNVP